ncbi:MAG: hypothetical protein U1F83_12525 [Verrucomicrobiota bacterium]
MIAKSGAAGQACYQVGVRANPLFQNRRHFLGQLALAAAGLTVGPSSVIASARSQRQADLDFLRATARKVLDSAALAPGAQIPSGAKNITGHQLRVPGGTLNYYPAFWVRDAAMMLGGDFISAEEVEGWIRVVATTQPGADGLQFGRLHVPPFSIPDHITMAGQACWFPGANTEQGDGKFGFLPPADDAFFFIQMVHEHWRLTRSVRFFDAPVKTGWGEPPLADVAVKAFDSVAADASTGLVIGEAGEGRTRVDWGFCDTIRKSGLCLMPSLLRWRAAGQLATLLKASGNQAEAKRLRAEATKIQRSIVPQFYRELGAHRGHATGCLLSATQLGCKDDVWTGAFAVWLGVLPRAVERKVAHHLLALYEAGGTVVEGQVRHLPPNGEFGGYWEEAPGPKGHYQNGGYWATPTGWFINALRRADAAAADRLLSEYVSHLRANEPQGAPWEWINPALKLTVNPRYGSSAGLVCVAITTRP